MSITKTNQNAKFDADEMLELATHISAVCKAMSTHGRLDENHGSTLSEVFCIIYRMSEKIHAQIYGCYSQFRD